MRWYFLLICLMIWCANVAMAQTPNRAEITEHPNGTFIEFVEGQYIVSPGVEPATTGWSADSNPNIDFDNKAGMGSGEFRSMVGRFYFDRDVLKDDLIAIHLIGMRGNFSVSMNGTELFRNFGNVTDQKNSWYRPFLIPVTDWALRPEINELLIHSFSRKPAGIGRVFIGSQTALQAIQGSRYFWHIAAPRSANFAMLAMGLLIVLLWFWRKNETELLWLAASIFLFFIRNHQYYTEDIPFDYKLYSDITVCANYLAMIALTAFYLTVVKFPRRRNIIVLMFLVGLPILWSHIFWANSSLSIYVTSAVMMTLVAAVAFKDLIENKGVERGILGFGVVLLPFASLHDLIILILYKGDGHATYLVVFSGAIYSATFIISFGSRALGALRELEQSQRILEQSIASTRAELMKSEAIRRELTVTQAMTSERARLMQEMHDGIGSNLTTALAVARKQKQSDTTITVLKRALGDLKLTVDSLEPVEGDIVALIGNLRHRMARDLTDAGITCKWEVEKCAPLPWLDAANALHVLRIHNEAISNILAHSHATVIRIGCAEKSQNGMPGIETYIADNGDGFDVNLVDKGKGLANITARAHSLHGGLSYDSKLGQGTVVRLWLPYHR